MSTGNKHKANCAVSRLRQDYMRLKKDPIPYITAEPQPSNLLQWHYIVIGPEATPYEGGYYHGKLVFPREFPFRPPAIYMITPNGRFKTNKRLCLSISDFHPDTWNPAWSVSTILTGLLSFMLEKSPTLGSIESTDNDKRQFAHNSLDFNVKDREFCELFPEITGGIREKLNERAAQMAASQLVEQLEDGGGQNGSGAGANGGAMGVGTRSVHEQGAVRHNRLVDLFVVIGFAAFMYTVKYVMHSSSTEP